MISSYASLAKFYDTLNSDCDYDKWSQYLLEMLKRHGIQLGCGCDLGCGSGILTDKLAANGFQMTGVDCSREMLENAYARAPKANFVYGDMRTFQPAKKQDFICSTCDAVNYLQPATHFKRFLSSAAAGLKSGGVLMFDVSSIYKFEHILASNIFADDTEEVTYIWQNDLKRDYIDMSFIIFTEDRGVYYKSYEQHRMYLYDVAMTEKALTSAGFTNINAYHAFTFDCPKADSERIQFVAVKE